MPANKNAMTRYKLLDDLLSNRYHDYSIADMTEYVNERLAEYGDGYSVSRRAIERTSSTWRKDLSVQTLSAILSMLSAAMVGRRSRNDAYDIAKRDFDIQAGDER